MRVVVAVIVDTLARMKPPLSENPIRRCHGSTLPVAATISITTGPTQMLAMRGAGERNEDYEDAVLGAVPAVTQRRLGPREKIGPAVYVAALSSVVIERVG